MGYESLTSELNWICDNAWKVTLGQSMFFIGSVVGTLIFGLLADVLGNERKKMRKQLNSLRLIKRFFWFPGRLPILILANIIAMLGNILTIFGTSVVRFSIFRFISGLATDSNFVMMYILGKFSIKRFMIKKAELRAAMHFDILKSVIHSTMRYLSFLPYMLLTIAVFCL